METQHLSLPSYFSTTGLHEISCIFILKELSKTSSPGRMSRQRKGSVKLKNVPSQFLAFSRAKESRGGDQ